MAHPPAISVRAVTKRFPGVTALEDVSLDVARGEVRAIVGENGAGKSTLMKLLAGVISDYEGELLVHGRPVRFAGTREAEQAGVSMIHQELNLVDALSVADNIFLGREPRRGGLFVDQPAMNRDAAALLAELECQVSPERPVGTCRIGDQQLVEIAKAISLSAEILIMDEPTSALTEHEVARLERVIARLRARGVTILYISHKLDEVFRLADRITVLRDGRLVETLERSRSTPQEIAHRMVGREIESVDLGEPRQPGAVVLQVRDLSLAWPGHVRRWRLREINFDLRRGEVLGLAGLMGAGRTELLECLFGAAQPRPSGQIVLEGRPVNFRHPADARAAGVALVTEDRKRLGLFPHLSVLGNVTLCQLQAMTRAGLVRPAEERRQGAQAIQRVGVKSAGLTGRITSLSGGNQQKALVARWLLIEPRVLLLDDPTRGVDVGAKAELYRLIDQLCRQGLGVIVTSSELPELLTLCDRILVLAEGRITAQFQRSEASEQAIMEAAALVAS